MSISTSEYLFETRLSSTVLDYGTSTARTVQPYVKPTDAGRCIRSSTYGRPRESDSGLRRWFCLTARACFKAPFTSHEPPETGPRRRTDASVLNGRPKKQAAVFRVNDIANHYRPCDYVQVPSRNLRSQFISLS
jgi:hypothetical protein